VEKEGERRWRLATRCVRWRGEPDPTTGALVSPIHQTSAFAFESVAQIQQYLKDDASHYIYTRYGNPTLEEAERKLSALEGAEEAVLFASGQAATTAAILSVLRAGDEILSVANIYGGTYRLFTQLLPNFGITTRFFRPQEVDHLDTLTSGRTRMIFIESPTNPTLEILDLSSVAASANRAGVLLAADNTFATPCNQSPLSLGADMVIHSATKYLGGHSDLIAGAVMGPSDRMRALRETMIVTGGCADPFAAFLLLRGLKTLAARMRVHNENAAGVAAYLASHPRARSVRYPGLETHPGHAVARRQMRGFGGLVTFEVDGGFDGACRVMNRFRLFLRAATLGGVESNAMLPVLASHAGYSDEELSIAGVTRAMIRLSVGIEDLEDLLEDLEQALS